MSVLIMAAGGSGERAGLDIPKQFIDIEGMPVFIHALLPYEQIDDITGIGIVIKAGWEEFARREITKHKINKVRWIIQGGESAQTSIRNGVVRWSNELVEDTIILIQDAVRPLVDRELILDAIRVCKLHGNAVSSVEMTEYVYLSKDKKTTDKYIPRFDMHTAPNPQAYPLGLLNRIYRDVPDEELLEGYTNIRMVDLGIPLHLSKGSRWNFKITTQEDLEMARAILHYRTCPSSSEGVTDE